MLLIGKILKEIFFFEIFVIVYRHVFGQINDLDDVKGI
jgi:hypothetical protein